MAVLEAGGDGGEEASMGAERGEGNKFPHHLKQNAAL